MFDFLRIYNFTASPYLNAIIIFSIFILAAVIIDFILTKVVKVIAKRTKTLYDDYIVSVIHKPILFTIILIGLYLAIDSLNPSDYYKALSEKITYSITLLIWMIAGIILTKKIIEGFLFKLFRLSGMSHDTIPIIVSLTKFVIIAVSILIFLTIWNINLIPIIASASIISAIILLAGKDTISNFFAGFSIIFDQPYKIGDYIDLDNTERGEVVEIGLRSTRIKTRDDILIAIPNAIIGNSKIINESAPEKRFRVRIPISIAYGTDIDKAESILLEIAKQNTNIVPELEPRVRLRSFADSSLNYELLCWAKEPALRGLTIHEINREIYKRFNELNISIPYPQRDLHIYYENEKKKPI